VASSNFNRVIVYPRTLLHEEQTKKPQAFSHCGHRVKKFIGSETTAAPVLSKLIEVFSGVESEMLFLRAEHHACC